MSTTYTALTETNFPDSIDNISRMSDLTADDLAHVTEYYTYYNAGNLTAAANVISTNSLEDKIFSAAKFNKLIDALVACEKFFRDDAYAYKGEYNSETTYTVGNVVFLTSSGCAYICKTGCTGKNPATETTYWGVIASKGSKGDQGDPGADALPEGTTAPAMDGVASVGSADTWSRSNHVHPTDTSRAPVSHTHALVDITGINATATEINYLDGASSNIQDQIDGKSGTSHTHTLVGITDVTATATEVNVLDGITASTTELNYMDGVTSNVQTQLNGKSGTDHKHGAADINSGTIDVARLPGASSLRTAAGISSGASAPSGGNDGDIYFQYSE